MPSQASESLVLRTWPLREADLVVSFFTRDAGKLRGVARRARKPKSPFGAGIERLSHVNMWFYARENRDLVTLERCELIHSQMALVSDFAGCVVLDYLAEVSEHLLPANEPNERFFRLLLAVLEYLRANPVAGVWPAVHYFSLWAVRLSGFLPEPRVSADSRRLADEIMRMPIGQLSEREWSAATAADLRRFLLRCLQDQIERTIYSAAMLETL